MQTELPIDKCQPWREGAARKVLSDRCKHDCRTIAPRKRTRAPLGTQVRLRGGCHGEERRQGEKWKKRNSERDVSISTEGRNPYLPSVNLQP